MKQDNASRREVRPERTAGNVRYDEKSGITGAGQQSGSSEDRCGFRRGRGIYRREKPSGFRAKAKNFSHEDMAEGDRLRPFSWG